MKKTAISMILVLAMVLAMVLVPVPVAEAAGTTHAAHTEGMNHCACGGTAVGVGDHTECTYLTGEWINLNNYVDTTGTSLATGNYYLTADLILTTVHTLKVDQANTTINICLNGFDIINLNNASSDDARCIYIYKSSEASTLNICDCQGGGKLHSEGQKQGAVLLAVNNTTANYMPTVNLFSGIFDGSPNTTQAGGTIRICRGVCNIYAATIQNGQNVAASNTWAGNLMISNTGTVNMYGGVIKNGTANEKGANVYVANGTTFNMFGGAIVGGMGGFSVETATASANANLCGGFIQLNKNTEIGAESTAYTVDSTNVKATEPLVIDLNGKTLSGELASITGKIGLADSSIAAGAAATAKVDIEGFGLANVDQVVASPVGRYITTEESGVLTIHRIYVGFDKIQLFKDDNGNVGMNYVTNFKMDDALKALLVAEGNAVGCNFGLGNLDNALSVGLTKAEYKADIATNINAILDGEGDAEAVATKICANAFVKLQIGDTVLTVTSNTYDYSLQDVIDAMYGVENLAGENAAAAALLTYIKEEFGIEASSAA